MTIQYPSLVGLPIVSPWIRITLSLCMNQASRETQIYVPYNPKTESVKLWHDFFEFKLIMEKLKNAYT